MHKLHKALNAKPINGAYRYVNKQGQQRCQKINFRFTGLWDTVLNWSGTSYNFDGSMPTATALPS